MSPAKFHSYVKVEFILPLDAKFEGVDWVHTKIPECPGHVNFGKDYWALSVPNLIYNIVNCRESKCESFIVERIPGDCVIQ